MLEAGKRGPALKNRLIGDAEMHQELLNRESLRADDVVKYLKDTLRPHFIKRAQSVFLRRFHRFSRARRGSIEMVKWIGKFALLLKLSRDAWMDMLLVSAMSRERRENQYRVDVTHENVERQRRHAGALDSNSHSPRNDCRCLHS